MKACGLFDHQEKEVQRPYQKQKPPRGQQETQKESTPIENANCSLTASGCSPKNLNTTCLSPHVSSHDN